MNIKKAIIFILFILSIDKSPIVFCQSYQADWQSPDQRPVPDWYPGAKFGIFIHWGIYSVPAWATDSYADGFGSNYAEWYWQRLIDTNLKIHKDFEAFHARVYGPGFHYQDFAPQFKCELFKPNEWAQLFKDAGAQYVVLTSKHHDGFCLWPSAQSWNWNSMDIGPHRDLAGELSDAVKQAGLHMGFYYSLYEWYKPLYRKDVNAYVSQHMLPQLRDLVLRYKPDVLWADGDWEQSATTWQSKTFLAWLYNESPVRNTIVVNDRWGNDTKGKHGDFYTSEYGHGTTSMDKPWEETRGIGQSFGYNRNEDLKDYASSNELIHELISIVARGGNFLLNIGPAADGTIPVIMQQRLLDIGKWLQVNGEAIYGTIPWHEAPEINSNTDVFFTQKGNKVFSIITQWKNEITINNISKPSKIELLGFDGTVQSKYKQGKLIVTLPKLTPDIIPCESAWTLKILLK